MSKLSKFAKLFSHDFWGFLTDLWCKAVVGGTSIGSVAVLVSFIAGYIFGHPTASRLGTWLLAALLAYVFILLGIAVIVMLVGMILNSLEMWRKKRR